MALLKDGEGTEEVYKAGEQCGIVYRVGSYVGSTSRKGIYRPSALGKKRLQEHQRSARNGTHSSPAFGEHLNMVGDEVAKELEVLIVLHSHAGEVRSSFFRRLIAAEQLCIDAQFASPAGCWNRSRTAGTPDLDACLRAWTRLQDVLSNLRVAGVDDICLLDGGGIDFLLDCGNITEAEANRLRSSLPFKLQVVWAKRRRGAALTEEEVRPAHGWVFLSFA